MTAALAQQHLRSRQPVPLGTPRHDRQHEDGAVRPYDEGERLWTRDDDQGWMTRWQLLDREPREWEATECPPVHSVRSYMRRRQ
jgi:hypothetical protein